MGDSLPALALVRDLLFASKITSAAAAAGVECRIIRQADRLSDQPGQVLLVDLNLPDAISAAARWGETTGGRVIGFVSHVDEATIAAARAAGLNEVLSRGQFAQRLPELLKNRT